MSGPVFSQLPPLALYIHLPWCVRKCPYCDFNSYQRREDIPEQAYVEALLRDLDTDLSQVAGREIISVFFGGGTPSLFSGAALQSLLDGVRARLSLAADVEITLEANPGTVDAAHFCGYREAGVNRLSIGAQSFDPGQLQTLGRIHDPEAITVAMNTAREAGFDNINLDLMFGLPGQSVAAALADLEQALALGPAHLSWYELTIEPNTAFHHRPPVLPVEDALADMQAAGMACLSAAGFSRYEVSAFARSGCECRHNINYWRFGDYLGIGAGAHGKLSDIAGGRILRSARQRQPAAYIRMAGSERCRGQESIVDGRQIATEFMMNALRLCGGFESSLFTMHTGLDPEVIIAPLARARELGLLERSAERIRPTARGMSCLNELLQLF